MIKFTCLFLGVTSSVVRIYLVSVRSNLWPPTGIFFEVRDAKLSPFLSTAHPSPICFSPHGSVSALCFCSLILAYHFLLDERKTYSSGRKLPSGYHQYSNNTYRIILRGRVYGIYYIWLIIVGLWYTSRVCNCLYPMIRFREVWQLYLSVLKRKVTFLRIFSLENVLKNHPAF